MSASGKNKVSIWKFDRAPVRLRRYHAGGGPAAWVAFVPKALFDKQLDARLRKTAMKRYETAEGDFVYIG